MSSQRVEDLMKLMKDSAYTCTEEWLQACLGWVQESFPNSQRTSAFLMKEIYAQWLDANLMEMKSSSLPVNLSQQRVTVLQGKFGLQVNSLEDIGESSYTQYNKLKKLENENTNVAATDSNHITPSWQAKPRRCLYLTMTDGSQRIFGMEHSPISALSLSLKPGFKIMLAGPIECRQGVLLLRSSQVQVLGGEIEALINSNSLENILSRNLNHPNPESNTRGNDNRRQITQNQMPRHTVVASNSSLPTQSAFPNDFDDDEDDIFMEIDESVLLGQTQDSSRPTTAVQIPVGLQFPTAPPVINQNSIPAKLTSVVQTETVSQSNLASNSRTRPLKRREVNTRKGSSCDEPISRRSRIQPTVKHPECVNLDKTEVISPADMQDNTCSVMEAFDDEPALVHNDFETKYKLPFQYIQQIKQRTFRVGEIVRVKATISTLVSNIKVEDGQWAVSVNINDGSGYLIAKISPQVLNRLVGFSPVEMKQMKVTKTPEAKERIANGLRNLTSKLVHLNAILCVRVGCPDSELVITGVEEIARNHVAELRERVLGYRPHVT